MARRVGVRRSALPRAVGLVYVSDAPLPTVEHLGSGPLPVQDRIAAMAPLPLHLLRAGFPSRAVVRRKGALEAFCAALGTELIAALRCRPHEDRTLADLS